MSENLRNIDRQLNDLWFKGQYMDACEVIADCLVPALKANLVSRLKLSMEDAEDAVADAYLGFQKKISEKGPLSITSPKAYIWTSAVRRGIDYKRRSRTADIPESQLVLRKDGEPYELVAALPRPAA